MEEDRYVIRSALVDCLAICWANEERVVSDMLLGPESVEGVFTQHQ